MKVKVKESNKKTKTKELTKKIKIVGEKSND